MKSNKRLLVRCKRVLAWLLAVTMVTGTLPTSVVHAAELPVQETVDDVSANDVAANDATDDVSVNDVTVDDVTAKVTEADSTVAETDKEVMAEDTTPAAASKAVVKWDADKLAALVRDAGFTYDYVAKQAEAAYQEMSDGDYTSLESYVNNAVKVEAGGKVVNVTPTYAWQQNGAAVATTKPAAVGVYQLVATVNATESVLASDPTTVLTLEIKKAPVEISLADNANWTFRAGITAAEVKTYVTSHLTFSVNGNETAQGDIATAVNLTVAEAYTGTACTDAAVLEKNKDYYVDVAVTLKENASYEVVESRFNLRLNEQTQTEIEVTYADAKTARAKGKVYDGTELAYNTAEGAFDSAAAGFTYKVLYDKDGNGECETELANAVITSAWCDADMQPMLENPVHAGVYYYVLTYADENGTYETASERLRVEIEPAKIMVVPSLPEEYKDKVYDGVTVRDILKQVDYKVYDVSTTGGRGAEKTDIDKKRFWGVYDYSVAAPDFDQSRNQYYEPLFEVQKGTTENNVVTWEPMEEWETIEWQRTEQRTVTNEATNEETTTTVTINYSYRIVFTGDKGVYDADGYVGSSVKGINDSQGDFTVSASLAVREAADNVYNITRSTATKVTINVDPICENGAGKTYDKPIERTYVGTYVGIYATRDEYKKAEVSGGDGVLNYAWYKLDESTIALDKDGKIKVDELEWDQNNENDSWFNGVDWYCSPYRAGVYRLEVSYEDPTCATYADPVSLYYAVHPQSAKVEITGSPEIYIDGVHTAEDLIMGLQNEDPNDKATYVELKGYRVNATGKNTVTSVELQDGETVDPVQTLVENYFDSVTNRPRYFCVERLRREGEENPGTWVKVSRYSTLAKDETYRISFDSDRYNSLYESADSEYLVDGKQVNYTFCRNTTYQFGLQLDQCNQVLDEEYYENGSANVAVKNSAAAVITIDTSAFEGVEKVYDGKPLDLAALKDKIKVTTLVDGQETDITGEVKPLLKYVIHDTSVRNGSEYLVVDEVNAVHAGVYNVDIVFETNEKYLQTMETVSRKFEIKQKEVSVKFDLREAVNAGVYFNGGINESSDQIFADEILKSDNVENVCTFELVGEPVKVDAVMDGENVLRPAVDESDVTKIVGKPHDWWINKSTDKNETRNYQGYLKSSETYYVKVTGFEYGTYEDVVYGTMSYDRDYVAVSEEKSFTPVRAAAMVGVYDTALNDKVTESEGGVFQHEITAREDVLFNYGTYEDHNGVAQGQDSNIFRFRLYAPGEFIGEKLFTTNSYVYENAIKNVTNAGGYVENVYSSYIIVAFDLALNKSVEFEVIFGKDYTEKYVLDLSKMVPEADMSRAVAPKSLAFNGAPKKLAVGEEVQLDVTVKKNQMSDIILLGYASDNEEVLQVSDTGYVTAVAKGSANIEVYPCRRVGGKLTRITEGKNLSKKLKITVTDVAKPKLSKVTGRDTKAFITYTIPANGYRRELYVMEGKKKEADFETAITDAVKNGDYRAFTYVNLSLTDKENDDYYCDSKKVVSNVEIYGLTPNSKDGYTVYLRNVSGLYVMADGTEVATSAAGAVKNFKTTKSEAQGLDVYYNVSDTIKRVYYDEEGPHEHESADNNYFDDDYEDDNDYYYMVNFSDKSSKVMVDAEFWETYSKDYSDNADYIWRTLPLGSDMKNSYNIPKMKFFVSDRAKIYDDREYNLNTDNMTKVDDHKWIYKTSYAKIDNSGKITYLGKHFVEVLAYDTVSKEYDWLTLYIDADPTSISAKAVKLQPGESIWLSNTLEYKEGSAKVLYYQNWYYDLVTTAESNEYFKIEYVKDEYNQYDEVGGNYRITALKAGGTLNIDVQDRVVTANGGRGTTLRITSPAVEPVKSAKVSAAYDDKFRVTFAYPRRTMNFRFELKNASGKVITDTIQSCTGKWDAKTKKYIYTVNFGDSSEWSSWNEWNTVGNNNVSAVVNGRNRITLLSNYTVGITAVYGERGLVNDVDKAEAERTQMSKTVNVKAKTTNVPASYWDVDAYNIARNKAVKADGGAAILLYSNSNDDSDSLDITDVLLKAGNTYDLQFDIWGDRENVAAEKRMSDSLTWKSSNTKVASIKANSGTFTAKLVAGKQGKTTIEVTSKLTKKVIARWTVTVNAVGDAKNYFGENTPYKNDDQVANPPTGWLNGFADLQKNATKLTLNNERAVELKAGQTKCFVFEAPAYGRYQSTGSGTTRDVNNQIITGNKWYEKGEKLYIYVTNKQLTTVYRTVRVEGEAYTEIGVGDNTVLNGGNYVFRAPHDNYYTCTYVDPEDSNNTRQLWANALEANEIKAFTVRDYSVEMGKEVTVRVTGREIAKTLTTAEAGNVLTLTSNQMVWYQFDAAEANLYTFNFEAKDGKQVSVYRATSLMEENPDYLSDGWNWSTDANKKLYVAVSSTDATADAPVEVTLKIKKREMAGTAPAVGAAETEVEFTKAEAKYYAFTAAADGFYKFTATGTSQEVTIKAYESLKDTSGGIEDWGSPAVSVYYVEANQTIYLEVTPDTVPTDGRATVKLKTEAVATVMNGADSKTFTLGDDGKLIVCFRLMASSWTSYTVTATCEDGSYVSVNASSIAGNGYAYSNNIYVNGGASLEGQIELSGTSGKLVTVTITKD